jgi:serine/threonine-protein kinase
VERVVAITSKLASALQALHARGILHRDIKPQNVLLDRNDEPFLTDFGLVRVVGDNGLTRDGVFVGTPAYASPEQASMRELDERSDIYSLGLVVFEMATGQRAFDGASTSEVLRMHQDLAAPRPEELRPDLPEGLSGLISRCLEKSPGQRFPTAAEIRVALDVL